MDGGNGGETITEDEGLLEESPQGGVSSPGDCPDQQDTQTDADEIRLSVSPREVADLLPLVPIEVAGEQPLSPEEFEGPDASAAVDVVESGPPHSQNLPAPIIPRYPSNVHLPRIWANLEDSSGDRVSEGMATDGHHGVAGCPPARGSEDDEVETPDFPGDERPSVTSHGQARTPASAIGGDYQPGGGGLHSTGRNHSFEDYGAPDQALRPRSPPRAEGAMVLRNLQLNNLTMEERELLTLHHLSIPRLSESLAKCSSSIHSRDVAHDLPSSYF